jgi:hypothetical protein
MDAQDDADGDAATAPTLDWEVRRYHEGNHFHPLTSNTGDGVTFPAPSPEDLFSTDPQKNYLQVRLTPTDSLGLPKAVTRRLEQRTGDVRFETEPLDFDLQFNALTSGAPKVFTSWEGYALNLDVQRQRDGSGRLWAFDHWSDGGAKAHTIETPAVPTTYTAFFRKF